MDYEQTLQYLYSALPMYQRVGKVAFKKNLTNTLALCEALDNPHEKFKSVHIAGTNGKGSSAHIIAAILQITGYKVGLYTSPHLKSFTERIRINGQAISRNEVVSFVEKNKQLIEEVKPSFFEITVAMAFDHFFQRKVDIAVIEVGLGGKLDSTNVITPEVSLITNIGLDHQEMLGDTLEQIAGEKAGIIKEGVPVVIGTRHPETEGVFKHKSQEMNAPITFAEDESSDKVYDIQLKGKYQQKNLPGVLSTIQVLNKEGFNIDKEHIQKGLQQVCDITGIKGRWQTLQDQPQMICDTGHNEDGVAEILQQIENTSYTQLHIVWGMVNDKDTLRILKMLPKDAQYYFCQANVPRAKKADELFDEAQSIGLKGTLISDVNEAIAVAKSNANEGDLIFIGGSTFVVAEISEL